MLIGSLALGLVVDDTIHFLHNFRKNYLETKDVKISVENTLLTSGRAMLTTSLVLSLGFFVYTASVIQNLRDFGILTALTIIMALLADFLVTPAIMNVFYTKKDNKK